MARAFTNNRHSNFELLRIICMLTIVYQHINTQTKWEDILLSQVNPDGRNLTPDNNKSEINSFRQLLIIYASCIGKVGVHNLVMISGYFQGPRPAPLKSMIRIWFRTASWCWIILFMTWAFLGKEHSNNTLKDHLFPVLTGQYWYPSTYLLVMAVSPLLSAGVEHLSQRKLARVITIMLLSVTVTRYHPKLHKIHSFYYCRLTLLYGLYLLGSYFRKYPKVLSDVKVWVWGVILAFFNIADLVSLWIFSNNGNTFVGMNGTNNCGNRLLMAADYSPLALIISIPLFLMFRKLELPSNKWINLLAGLTYGVYIAHDNPLIRPYNCNKLLHMERFYDSGLFYIIFIVGPTGLYLLYSAAEYVRHFLLSRVEGLIVTHVGDLLPKISKKLGDLLCMEEEIEDKIETHPAA